MAAHSRGVSAVLLLRMKIRPASMVVTDTSDGVVVIMCGRAGLRGVNLDKAKQSNQCIFEDRDRPSRNQSIHLMMISSIVTDSCRLLLR